MNQVPRVNYRMRFRTIHELARVIVSLRWRTPPWFVACVANYTSIRGVSTLGGSLADFASTLCCSSTLGYLSDLISTLCMSSLLGFETTITIHIIQKKNIAISVPKWFATQGANFPIQVR
jgi:hypothetical protein